MNIINEIDVKGNRIRIMNVNGVEYISLTDLAKYADPDEPRFPVANWMRGRDVIAYLGLWESINNKNFNRVEFDTVKSEAGYNKFRISPKKWVENTNAIGMISKSGRYDAGTFAHPDIAFEFASWLSPEFKLYVITEFQRLKRKENLDNKLEWHAGRLLTKINYVVQTNAIKCDLVPTLTQNQKKYIYASEADLLNVALFGMTAKEWKSKNPNSSIRDNANLLQLIVLNNLENINAELIKLNMSQEDRLIRLNKAAKEQIELLNTNSTLENFSDQKLLIEKEII